MRNSRQEDLSYLTESEKRLHQQSIDVSLVKDKGTVNYDDRNWLSCTVNTICFAGELN